MYLLCFCNLILITAHGTIPQNRKPNHLHLFIAYSGISISSYHSQCNHFFIMTNEEYYSIKDRLSPSMIGTLLQSCPADVQRKLIYGVDETPAMARGTLGHAATLEPERVRDEFVLFDRTKLKGAGSIAKTPKYKKDGTPDVNTENLLMVESFKQECEQAGKTAVIDTEEYAKIQRVAGILHNHPFWQIINDGALIEHAMLWTADNGCLMRGKADHINDTYGIVSDVKFMADISPEAIIRSIYDRMYHGQIASYQDGYGKTSGKQNTINLGVVIACDIKTLDVVVYGLPDTYTEAKDNWTNYSEYFTRELRPLWKDISIQTGRELYQRATERWLDWNQRYGNCWETVESVDEETGEVKITPVNQWPGWDFISRFEPSNKLRIFKL
jgi:hypothetical protein